MLDHHRLRLTAGIALLALVAACSKSPTAPDPNESRDAVTIVAQPQSQTVAPGTSATLSVAASAAAPVAFQWYVGTAGETTAPVAGATSAAFTTPTLSSTTNYWVRVTAGATAVNSATATIAVDTAAPSIVEQPRDEAIASGQTARLGVDAVGSSPLTYQWFRGESGSTTSPVDGASGPKFTTPVLTETTRFWVRVSNSAGAVNSRTSTVTVAAAAAPPAPGPSAPVPEPPAPAPGPAPAPPPPAPVDPSATAFENEVLVLVNQRRAAGATCGATAYGAAPAVSMNGNLRNAARDHSQDMATQNYFSHTSLDGRTFVQRMTNAGYSGGGPYGENIAAGYSSPAAVVAGWMTSVGHCQAIMNPSFRVIGAGYAFSAAATYGSYWTLNFAGG